MMGTVTQDTGIAAKARQASRITTSRRFSRRYALAAAAFAALAAAVAAIVLSTVGRDESNTRHPDSGGSDRRRRDR